MLIYFTVHSIQVNRVAAPPNPHSKSVQIFDFKIASRETTVTYGPRIATRRRNHRGSNNSPTALGFYQG